MLEIVMMSNRGSPIQAGPPLNVVVSYGLVEQVRIRQLLPLPSLLCTSEPTVSILPEFTRCTHWTSLAIWQLQTPRERCPDSMIAQETVAYC